MPISSKWLETSSGTGADKISNKKVVSRVIIRTFRQKDISQEARNSLWAKKIFPKRGTENVFFAKKHAAPLDRKSKRRPFRHDAFAKNTSLLSTAEVENVTFVQLFFKK